MRYELYIDIFFLENLMMDFLLLMFLKRILGSTASGIRVLLGAVSGAALTCAVIILPVPYAVVKMLLFYGVVTIIMLKTGLNVEWGRELLRAAVFLYIGAFLLGGIMSFFGQYLRSVSLFFVLSLFGYYLASGIWSLIALQIGRNKAYCEAVLYNNDKSCHLKALIDTGNRLRDEVTGKPVSIIQPETARLLGFFINTEDPGRIRYISYHSIGKEAGVLPLFEIEKIQLTTDRKKTEVIHPLLAVCEGELDLDDYGMILNPDIYIGGNK